MLTDYAYQALYSKHRRPPKETKGPYKNGELFMTATHTADPWAPIYVAA